MPRFVFYLTWIENDMAEDRRTLWAELDLDELEEFCSLFLPVAFGS